MVCGHTSNATTSVPLLNSPALLLLSVKLTTKSLSNGRIVKLSAVNALIVLMNSKSLDNTVSKLLRLSTTETSTLFTHLPQALNTLSELSACLITVEKESGLFLAMPRFANLPLHLSAQRKNVLTTRRMLTDNAVTTRSPSNGNTLPDVRMYHTEATCAITSSLTLSRILRMPLT